jgi:hypothetical protein
MRKLFLLSLSVIVASVMLHPGSAKKAQDLLFVPGPNSPIAVARGPSNIFALDINGDARLDLIVPSGETRTITILLGHGDGTFETHPDPIMLPEAAGEMAAGDINGDGKADLVISSHDSYAIMLLWGTGKGSFTLAPTSPFIMKDGQHPHTHGFGLGDLNGDGHLDLVTANNEDNDIAIAFGDARGGFTRAASPYPVSKSPYPLTLADLNSDGHLDIVSTSATESSRELTVLFGDGRGGFKTQKIAMQTPGPWYVAVADVNNDHNADMVMTHWSESKKLSVLLGQEDGTFNEPNGSPFDLGHNAWSIRVVDVNHDGHVDVIAAAGYDIRLMLGNSQGGFRPAPGSPLPSGKGAWKMATADLNGDGKIDIATSNLESHSVSILLAQ